jgi:hypothetical protein
MPKLLSDLKLKAKIIVKLFLISLIFTLILILLLKHKNIIYTNNKTNNKIYVIIRQM